MISIAAEESEEEEVREKMKAVTAKRLWSISGVVVAAFFLSVVLTVCAHIAVLAQGAAPDFGRQPGSKMYTRARGAVQTPYRRAAIAAVRHLETVPPLQSDASVSK